MGTVSGTVTDSMAATPIVGAKVYLRGGAGGGGGGAIVDSAVTGTDGSYTLSNTPTRVAAYTLNVSAATYTARTVNVTVANATPVTANIKLLKIVYGSITGTITDSSTATPIASAKIYLRSGAGGGGGAIIDSATTGSDGTYSLTNIATRAGAYTLAASATGYVSKNTAVTVADATPVTADVKLVAIVMGSISGAVTDSVAATPIAGAKVYLRSGFGGGATLDSAVSASDGSYTIVNVSSGATYTLSASATGYVSKNVTVAITGTAAVTENFKLLTNPKGSIFMFVKKASDSSAIAAAGLSYSLGGAITPLTADANGEASILNVATGNYTITASADGFTTRSVTTALARDQMDTVKIYLVASTAGTKTLKGMVKDSAANMALAHVAVELVIGAAAGSPALDFIDSTDATGAYMFTGIPVARTAGRVTAILAGYRTFTNGVVSLGAANAADTTTLNINLIVIPTSINAAKNGVITGTPGFGISASGLLRLNNFTDPGVVNVFDLNGRLLYHGAFQAHATSLALPAQLVKSGNAYIIGITQNSAVYRKQVMVP